MANELKMAIVESIRQLLSLRWSQRRIAKELGIDRGAVARQARSLQADPKPAIPPTGSDESKPAGFSCPPAPGSDCSADDDGAACNSDSKPAISPTGSRPPLEGRISPAGRRSDCEAYAELILPKIDAGLSAQRIWQDLTTEHGFAGSYYSVKRFVRRFDESTPLPFRRMECAAGEEAQVDFGTGAQVVGPDGKRRKTHVFRIVLSYSRKGYCEATFTQTTDDFLRALENAFAHFGGVPKTLVIDNLKAAVSKPDWFDPELTPKLQSFARHYGTVILPTKPYMPRHKGKIEAGVKYVKNNGLKGRTFASLEEQNRFLENWEAGVADKRIHGTTKRQVAAVFAESERSSLLPRPLERFACFQEGRRQVNRDGHVEVAKAYYSVPPEYLGRTVWVRWDTRLVRVFNHRWEQVAIHVRHERGRFSTRAEHLAPEKIHGLERGAGYLLSKVRTVGPETHEWAQAMLAVRGIQGTRVLQGVLSLAKKFPAEALETACAVASSHGAYHLRSVRKLVGRRAATQSPLPFLDAHPIIRPMEDYAAVIGAAIRRQADRSSLNEGFFRHGRTEERPGKRVAGRGAADVPSGSGYPSSGCPSAEPDSVLPDDSRVVPRSSPHQEKAP
jgi:transposase